MNSNLDQFKVLDDAYNARDWETYGSFFDEKFCGQMMGESKPHGKAEHISGAKEFCAVSADNKVHNTPYTVALSDGEWTCTIARFTGTMKGRPFPPDGKMIKPINHSFDTTFATFTRWADGKILEEYEFLDAAGIMRQTGSAK